MIEVLLVDDDALMRGLLAEWLSEAGYRVRHADNGVNALRLLRARRFGLLITDMDMPISDGTQILNEVRCVQPELAVIAISGGDRDRAHSWVATALKLGAAKALAKPIERRELLAAVEELVPRDKSGTPRA